MTLTKRRPILTNTTQTSKSPLGNKSSEYRTKKNSKGSILDTPSKGLIELYPSGYTKSSVRDKKPRQVLYKKIYKIATLLKVEDKLYPFGREGSHRIELQVEPDNKYDPSAVAIILRAKEESPLATLDGMDMGYVPKKISTYISANIHMFTGGAILKVKKDVYDKYWQCKIILSYNNVLFAPLKETTRKRFSAIVGE